MDGIKCPNHGHFLGADPKNPGYTLKCVSGCGPYRWAPEVVTPPKDDPVLAPSHYTAGGIECIDYLRAKMSPEEFAGFCRGNAIKYLSRAGKKDDAAQDAEKAVVYAGWLADALTGKKLRGRP